MALVLLGLFASVGLYLTAIYGIVWSSSRRIKAAEDRGIAVDAQLLFPTAPETYAWDNPLNLYDLDGRDVCVPTPFGEACAEDAAEDVGNAAGNAANAAWSAGGGAAGAAGSAAESAWNWTQPGRSWVGERAQDFWKEYGSTIGSLYRFAGGNWETCLRGGSAGAAAGFVLATPVPVIGNAAGAVIGGIGGCAGLVGAKLGIESMTE